MEEEKTKILLELLNDIKDAQTILDESGTIATFAYPDTGPPSAIYYSDQPTADQTAGGAEMVEIKQAINGVPRACACGSICDLCALCG